MSLGNALNTSLESLNVMGIAMDYVSSSIAGSNSIGFKNPELFFQSMVIGNAGITSSVRSAVLKVRPVLDAMDNQAYMQTQTTSTGGGLSIAGRGLFIVSNKLNKGDDGRWHPQDIMYTRTSTFTKDKDGNLVDPNGHYLLGWGMGKNGKVENTNSTADMFGINIDTITNKPSPTHNIAITAQLDAAAAVGDVFTFDQTFYDRLGKPHRITFTYKKVSAGDSKTAAKWELFAKPTDGAKFVQPQIDGKNTDSESWQTKNGFQPDGKLNNDQIKKMNATNAMIVSTTNMDPNGFDLGTFSFDKDGGELKQILPDNQPASEKTAGGAGVPSSSKSPFPLEDHGKLQFIIAPDGDSDLGKDGDSDGLLSVTLDFGGLGNSTTLSNVDNPGATHNSSGADTPGKKLNFSGKGAELAMSQDGYGVGIFNGVTITQDGTVQINYSNDQHVPMYVIPLASFANYNGLSAGPNGTYLATTQSGSVLPHQPGQGGVGTINYGAVEASNVDQGKELGDSIKYQQTYAMSAGLTQKVKGMMDTLAQLART